MGFESRGEMRGGMASVVERISKQQYETAHRKIEQRKINIDDFAEMYKDSIDRDKKYVRDRQAAFKIEDAKMTTDKLTNGEIRHVSECAENIIMDGIDSGWIPDTVAIKTTDYDDIANGVDVILERQKNHGPSTHLALGIDITCSKSMDGKLYDIKKMIDEGKLPTIKYFKSGNFKGELSNVPKVIAAIDIYAVERFEKEKTKGTDLSKHPIRLILLKQFEMQLDAFIAYARTANPGVVPPLSIARESVRAMAKDLEPEIRKHAHLFAEHPTLVAMNEKLAELFPARPNKPTTGRILRG